MKGSARSLILFFFVLFILPIAAFGASDQPITIGLVVPQTGPFTFQGEHVTKGFTLALEQASYKVAGRPIKVVIEDEVASPAIALTKTQKLVEKDKVDLVIGPVNSASSLPMREYLVPKQVPWIIPLAMPEVLTLPPLANKYTFRLQVEPSQANFPFADWLYKKKGFKRMAGMGIDFPAGRDSVLAFKQGLEKAGGQLVQEIFTPVNNPDFGPFLSQLKRDIDAVYAWFAGADAIKFDSQYVDFGLKDKIPLTGWIGINEETIWDSIKDNIKGNTVITPYTPSLDLPENKKFLEAYRARYKSDPALPGVNAYDCVKVFLAAAEAVQGDLANKDKFLEAMSKVKMESPRGPIFFDERGQVVADVYICVADVKDGKLQNVVVDTIKGVRQRLP
jgi:branched-chain amino acid transport system substrate-binding protein